MKADTLYGNICTSNYYSRAFKEIYDEVTSPKFFIFSDDEYYCKSIYKEKEMIVVPTSMPEDAYIDLILMTKCKHHILANSSYSWWGAALSKRNGITVMPSRHNNRMVGNPLMLNDSIIIDNKGRRIQKALVRI